MVSFPCRTNSSSVLNGSSSTNALSGELSVGIASIPLSFKNCLATFKSEASDLNVARQFLKDNGIEAIPTDNSPLKALVDELPFNTEEELVLHGKDTN